MISDNSKKIDLDTVCETRVYKPDGSVEQGTSSVITEHRMTIYVNERAVLRLVCTPANLKELVIGRLITEGYIHGLQDVEQLYICDSGHTAKVFLKKPVEWVSSTERFHGEDGDTDEVCDIPVEPTCCTDNKVLMAKVEARLQPLPTAKWQPEWVFALARAFKQDSQIHKTTWGTHSCYLGVAGKVVFSAEDIGRHNAMDKAIGYAAIMGMEAADCMLFTTGRVPVDMVTKAITAGVPVLISKAVPTAEAVELATKYGLTLICKAWPDSFEVYHKA